MVRSALLAMLLVVPSSTAQDKEKEKVRKSADYSRKIDAALKKKDSAPLAGDAEFLRRVTLDLTGNLPTAGETRAFLADASPTKRQDAVETLLGTEAHADLWSRMWCFVLFGNYYEIRASVGGKNVVGKSIRKAFDDFRKWLREQVAKDVAWPQVVFELIQSTGKLSANPVLLYKTSFYYEGEPSLNLADGMAKSLLGMRISCARCHDHPFDRWTQEDYYGLAAFFVRIKGVASAVKDDNTEDVEFSEDPKGELTMPVTSKVLRPKFLFGGTAAATEARLPALARFMVTPQLTRNVINRVWAWLMGRGFVEPVDDFNAQNKPIHAALMEDLARGFAANGYSMRFLIRAICNSEAYQRASAGEATEPFSTGAIRQLSGEQLFKSIVTALASSDGPVDFASKGVAQKWNEWREHLRPLYGADGNWTEVSPLPGNTRQALLLRNSGFMDGLLKWEGGLPAKVKAMPGSIEEKIDLLFLSVLVRPPTDDERLRYAEYLRRQGEKREAFEDVVWTLMNSAEFATRH